MRDPLTREIGIRACALYVPLVALGIAAFVRRPARRERNAAILACIWNLPGLAIVHQLAVQQGWWTIHGSGGAMLLGMPVEVLAGWMLLWGALPAIAAPRVPLALVVLVLCGLDLAIMPLCEPVVQLAPAPAWLIGEAVALAVCLVPAQLFARWTRDDTHLAARATLQVACFAALTFWLVPSALFEHVGEGWRVLQTYDGQGLSIALQLVALAALPGVSAVQEFVRRGRGTPVPFDPPRRLVTTGIYAYVANPIQLSTMLTLFAWGITLRSWWIAVASTMTLVYGSGLAAWDEKQDLGTRFGASWRHYRDHVRNWWPRWRPYIAPVAPTHPDRSEARLYVAFTCSQCSGIGGWLRQQHPRGLRIEPAEQHPTRDLWRMTYDPGDGSPDERGVAALARALEHIHLGWALAGMFVRLPLVRPCVQLIVDISGGGPRRTARRGTGTGDYCPR